MENLYTSDSIRTFTGIYMNVFQPTEEMICIEDIAHALSLQCRFGGHLPEFYSVAQHSVLCSRLAGEKIALQALMHDAAEAYLIDLPRPIKKKMDRYQEIEFKLMKLICKKFGLRFPLHPSVKRIDDQMLQLEWEELMLQKNTVESFRCWSPEYAKRSFLEEFETLKN